MINSKDYAQNYTHICTFTIFNITFIVYKILDFVLVDILNQMRTCPTLKYKNDNY